MPFKFIQIKNLRDIEEGHYIDIIGLIIKISPIRNISKEKNLRFIKINIIDDSFYSINCALWNKMVFI